jgi:hypothetical protein
LKSWAAAMLGSALTPRCFGRLLIACPCLKDSSGLLSEGGRSGYHIPVHREPHDASKYSKTKLERR